MADTPTAPVFADPRMLLAMDPMAANPADIFQFVPLSILSSALASTLLSGKVLKTYSISATLNASLLTGRQTVTVNVPGLLTTDQIVECQPLADLPGNLGIVYSFISATDTLKVAFSTPILYTGNSAIPLRLSVLR